MSFLKKFSARKSFSKWFSDEGLTKKASLNTLASTLDYVASTIVSFFINPFLVSSLGDFGYGAWQVLGRMIGFVTPATGRPTQALKWTIANQQASTDYDEKRQYVGSTVAVWLLFLPVLAILGGILVWFAPTWLDTPTLYYQAVRLATALLVIDLIMTSLVEIPRAILRGENLGYKRMGLSALLIFAGGGFTALALYFKTGLVGVASAALATTLLTGVLFLQVVHTYVPWFGIARPSSATVRSFINLSGWFLAWNLILRALDAGDVVILGLFDSAELVTSYSLTKYAPGTLINVMALIVTGVTPGLGGIIGSKDLPRVIRLRNELMSLTWLLVTIGGSGILLWNRSFIQLWVGADYYAGSLSTLLIIVMVSQYLVIRNDANIIDLTLDLRHKVLIGLLSVAISLLGAGIVVGIFNLGIVGLCLSFIIGRLVLSLGYPWIVGRFLDLSLFTQLKGALRPMVVTALLFAITSSISSFLKATSWLGFILAIGITLLIVTPLTFYAGLAGEQRARIWKRVMRVIRPAATD